MTLFECYFKVPRHASKKNNKRIRKNRRTGKYFVGTDDPEILLEKQLVQKLMIERLKKRIDKPITDRIIAKFTFFMPMTVYYTKKAAINLKIGDISNLYQMPEDALTKAGIIEDDTLIEGHDGSRRLPIDSTEYFLKIELIKV
jgi:Holliday junction resolvase RusA-like endonuclease